MDNTENGSLVNKPPVLDDTNYEYWKVKMISFLKSTDNKTWKAVVKGWKYPVITSQGSQIQNACQNDPHELTHTCYVSTHRPVGFKNDPYVSAHSMYVSAHRPVFHKTIYF